MVSESARMRILDASVNALNSTVKYAWWATYTTTHKIYENLPSEEDFQQMLNIFVTNSERLRKDFRLKLRQQNVESILDSMHTKIKEHCLRHNMIDQLRNVNCISRQLMFQTEMKPTQYLFLKENKIQNNERNSRLLAQLIWQLLADIQNGSLEEDDDMAKVRIWNTRIDESSIIKRISDQDNGDTAAAHGAADLRGSYGGSGDIAEHSSKSKEPVNENEIISHSPLLHKTEFCVCNAGYCDANAAAQFKNQLESDDTIPNRKPYNFSSTQSPRKKHGMLHPIQKLFRTEKTIQDSQALHLNSSYNKENMSDIKPRRLSTDRLVTEPTKLAQHGDNPATEANNAEPLLIHVPSTVQKIVLVKDGRKISIEI